MDNRRRSANTNFHWDIHSSFDNLTLNTRGSLPVPDAINGLFNQANPVTYIERSNLGEAVFHISPNTSINMSDQANEDNQDASISLDGNQNDSNEAEESVDGNADNDSQPNRPNSNAAVNSFLTLVNSRVLTQLVFISILLFRVIYEHRLGILIYIAMFGTFFQADSVVKKLVLKREVTKLNWSFLKRCWILIFPVVNIGLIYYIFDQMELYRIFYFHMPPVTESRHLDISDLLWIVLISDMTVKYITVEAKVMIMFIPRFCLSSRNRGKWLLCVEKISSVYRSLITIVPWYAFLSDQDYGGYIFSYVLLFVYAIAKSVHVFSSLRHAVKAIRLIWHDSHYGSIPDKSDLRIAGNSCSICHDNFSDPIRLSCSHIFCEECITTWFDREQTCPMCRKKIIEKPLWRDGSTEMSPAWF